MTHIKEYSESDIDAVAQFKTRLQEAGLRSLLSETPVSPWLPKLPERKLFQEFFLALDEHQTVRGGYILKHQEFHIGNRPITIACYHGPISEGVINPQYRSLGLKLVMDALSRQPKLFNLGMEVRLQMGF